MGGDLNPRPTDYEFRYLSKSYCIGPPSIAYARQAQKPDSTALLAVHGRDPYTVRMQKKTLLANNPHLKNASAYKHALRVNVLSSMAIEGVRKAAEKALPPVKIKTAKA